MQESLPSNGIGDEVVLSEFLTELSALPIEVDMSLEEESQRRSQRKRVEKFDPDDEAYGPRKKRPKVADPGTTAAVDEKPSKNNKRSDSPFEEAVVTETEKLRSKYDDCVANLVSSHSDFEEDEVLMPFLRLAELWLRWLELLRRRLSEVEALNGEINRTLERIKGGEFVTKEGKVDFDNAVIRLKNWSQRRSIATPKVAELLLINEKLNLWTQEAEAILRRNQLKTTDELRDFIKSGEGFNVFLPQLDVLRTQHKRSKAWISKFQRLNSGKTPSNAELEELSAESEQLLVNLDEYTSLISLDTKKYCICRQSYHSEMIGCDECDEWYHLQCVGLSQAQADKLERYLCIRCTLRQSFNNAAMLAAQSINKWMNASDVLRAREQRLSKVTKRVAKEEKELERIQVELSKLVQMGKQRQESEMVRLGADHPAVSMFGARPPTAEEAEQQTLLALLSQNNEITVAIRKYTNEYEVLKQSLKRNQAEEKEVQATMQLEHNRSSDISQWMESLKAVLWPSSADEHSLGAPLPTGDLPIGVKRAAVEAERLGISKVEDVVYVLQCFLWMGWCFRCSMSIRGPISTNELRRLVNASRSIKFYDDRIVKILVGVLTRAK